MSFGTYAGVLSWADFSGYVFLPNTSITFGSLRQNFNFTLGYALVGYEDNSEGNMFISLGGTAKTGKNWSFVFEAMILPIDDDVFGVITPALRYYTKSGNAFQFGFAGALYEGEVLPLPIPTIQWFWKL